MITMLFRSKRKQDKTATDKPVFFLEFSDFYMFYSKCRLPINTILNILKLEFPIANIIQWAFFINRLSSNQKFGVVYSL